MLQLEGGTNDFTKQYKMGNLCYTRINTLDMVQKPFTRPYKNVMCVIQNIICLGLKAVHMPLLSCIKMCNLC